MMQSGLERKTQAAVAERIADLEGLESIPRDLVSRVFREQAVDAQSIARVAAALDVEPKAICKDEPQRQQPAPSSVVTRSGVDTWIALAGAALIGALLAAATMLTFGRDGDANGQRTLQGFYAEMGDVYRHYLYSEDEFISDPDNDRFGLQLSLAVYDGLSFARSEIARLGLTPDEVRWSMELLLLVRNNDLRIAELRTTPPADPIVLQARLTTLKARMGDARDVAYTLLSSIREHNPAFGQLPLPPKDFVPAT